MALKTCTALAVAVLLTLGVSAAPGPAPALPPPRVGVGAGVLVDAATGQVLWAHRAYRQMDPASTTKIMTAYLVIRAGGLERTAAVSRRAAATPGSRMHLSANDRYTIMDLLRGLLLPSGNDAAVALAEAESGSVPAFVAEMNREARALGAYQTHFVNPNGLTERGHYSSAYDLALIARAALGQPVFQHLVSTPEARVTELRRGARRVLHNSNRLLEAFPAVDGVKTGTTNAAGPCLVASATQHGTQLIAVVLHAPHRWQAAASLLRWGFAAWHRVVWLAPTHPVAQIRVTGGTQSTVAAVPRSPLSTLVPHGAVDAARFVTTSAATLRAPVRRGAVVGRVTVVVNGTPVGSRQLVAAVSVERRVAGRPLPWPWTLFVRAPPEVS